MQEPKVSLGTSNALFTPWLQSAVECLLHTLFRCLRFAVMRVSSPWNFLVRFHLVVLPFMGVPHVPNTCDTPVSRSCFILSSSLLLVLSWKCARSASYSEKLQDSRNNTGEFEHRAPHDTGKFSSDVGPLPIHRFLKLPGCWLPISDVLQEGISHHVGVPCSPFHWDCCVITPGPAVLSAKLGTLH